MSAGGGTHDADLVRVDVPSLRIGADGSQRARRVAQHDRVPVTGRAKPVLEHEPADAVLLQELRVSRALVRGQSAVTAAGADDNRRAGVIAGRGKERRQRRDVAG